MTQPARAVNYARKGAIAVVCIDNPPVNALGHAVRQGLIDAMARAEAENVQALVLCGAGRGVLAGADVREFGQPPRAPLLLEVCNRIEAAGFPVIAALQGVCLGGGLELALAAHYRVAHPGTRIGLPEVTLGLIPGAGGTQRLPRLTSIATALDLVASGRQIPATEARELGILDRLSEEEVRQAGLCFAQEIIASGKGPRRLRDVPSPDPADWDAAAADIACRAKGRIAPLQALAAVRAASELPFAEGMAEERRIFMSLMHSDERAALLHVFMAERAAGKLPELAGVSPMAVQTVGVVGGGTMGAGIATALLIAGLCVVLVESSNASAETARDRIARNLEGAVRRGKITSADCEIALDRRLMLETDYKALSDADLVIEAIFEDMNLKRELFAALDTICKDGAVLATNTSYLDVNTIADATLRPGDVIGLHFFSPAHVMKLLEIVVPERARPQVVATGFDLARRLGKIGVRAGVGEGFIGNRILTACRAAADYMVLEGASPRDVDRALEEFGFAMGPYAVADLAGLDIGWANRKRLAARGDPQDRIAAFPDRLCEAGHFGRKTGKGYYVYTGTEGLPPLNPEAVSLIEQDRARSGVSQRSFGAEDIQLRYMAAMVNEAARVLDEGVARRPLDIDLVMVLGYGFPRYRGGPCHWADRTGLGSLLAETEHLAEKHARLPRPAPLLRRLADADLGFADFDRVAVG